MRAFRVFLIFLMFLGSFGAMAEQSVSGKDPSASQRKSDAINAELEVMNRFLEASKEKQSVKDVPEDARESNKVKPSSGTNNIPERLDSLEANAGGSKEKAQAVLDALDARFPETADTTMAPDNDSTDGRFNRDPECVVATFDAGGDQSWRALEAYLTGTAKLELTTAKRRFLRDCALMGDGQALLVLVLERIGSSSVNGAASAEWVVDALLTAGEYGAFWAGLLADAWITKFAEEQHFLSGLYLRLTNTARMARLQQLAASNTKFAAMVTETTANSKELRTLLKNTRADCRKPQENFRALPESGREDFKKIIREVAAGQEQNCKTAGIDILYAGPLPRHSVAWASGVSSMRFSSGGRAVEARDVARLLDDWRSARARNHWNSSYSKFVHFSDDAQAQYLAGYDPYALRNGDTQLDRFRILRVDFPEYRRCLQSFWREGSDVSYKNFGTIEQARQHAQKVLLALDPGLYFLMGHYQEEGLWEWDELEKDLMHPSAYVEAMPFFEYETMVTEAPQ